LGYYLNDKVQKEENFIIEQGYEMKRPGLIYVSVDGVTIRVGGKTRMVLQASLYLE
jgi:predicted PhzF superfamily epimerase YddE/YHI9